MKNTVFQIPAYTGSRITCSQKIPTGLTLPRGVHEKMRTVCPRDARNAPA